MSVNTSHEEDLSSRTGGNSQGYSSDASISSTNVNDLNSNIYSESSFFETQQSGQTQNDQHPPNNLDELSANVETTFVGEPPELDSGFSSCDTFPSIQEERGWFPPIPRFRSLSIFDITDAAQAGTDAVVSVCSFFMFLLYMLIRGSPALFDLVVFFNPVFSRLSTRVGRFIVGPDTEPYYKHALQSVVSGLLGFSTLCGAALYMVHSSVIGVSPELVPLIVGSLNVGFSFRDSYRAMQDALLSINEVVQPKHVWSPTYALFTKAGMTLDADKSIAISFVESVIMTVFQLRNAQSTTVAGVVLASFFKSLNHLAFQVNTLLFDKVLEKVTPIATASVGEFINHFQTLVGLFVAVPLLAAGSPKKAESVMNAYQRYGKKRSNLVDSIVDAFNFVKERGGAVLYGSEFDDLSFKTWYKESAEFLHEHTPFQVVLNESESRIDLCNRVRLDIKALLNRSLEFDVFEEDSRAYLVVRDMTAKLKEMDQVAAAEIIALAVRRFPIGIHIFGESNIGKSWTTKKVFDLYFALFNIPGTEDSIHRHATKSNYMDGYNGQPGLLLEDINAILAKIQPDSKTMGIFDFFSNFASLTHQAALEAKNTTPFVSEIVVANSNDIGMHFSDYFNMAFAGHRRFPHVIEHILQPEYSQNGQIDSDKVRGNEAKAFMFKVHRPIPPSFTREDTTGATHSSGRFMSIESPSGSSLWTLAELFVHLKEVFQAHYAVQTRVIQSMSSSKFCMECQNIPEICCDPDNHEHVDRSILAQKRKIFDEAQEVDVPVASVVRDYLDKHKAKLAQNVPIAIAVSAVGVVATKLVYDYYLDKKNPVPTANESKDDFYYSVPSVLYNHVQRSTPMTAIENIAKNNSYVLVAINKVGSPHSWVNADHVADNLFITVKHIFHNVDRVYLISHYQIRNFQKNSSDFNSNLFDVSMLEIEEVADDSVTFRTPGFTPMSKGIFKHINSSHIVEPDALCKGYVFRYNGVDGYDESKVHGRPKYRDISYPPVNGEDNMKVRVGELCSGNKIEPGMCGSLIWAINSNGPGACIIGIICAAIPIIDNACFIPFNQEMLRDRLRPIPEVASFRSNMNDLPNKKKKKFYPDSTWSHVPGIHKELFSFDTGNSPRTKCRPALFHGFLKSHGLPVDEWEPPRFKPHRNDKGLPIYDTSPLNRAATKFKQGKAIYEKQFYDRAMQDLEQILDFCFDSNDVSQMTIEEAINSSDYLPSLNMQTSCGYPTFKGKADVISWDYNTEQFVPCLELRQAVNEALGAYDRGERIGPIFTVRFKDEVNTPAKNEIGKVRAFNMAPLVYLIVQRMILGRSIGEYKSKRGHQMSAHVYGINHNADWTKITTELVNFSENILCGDFKSFDFTQSGQFIYDISELWRKCMEKTGTVSQEHSNRLKMYSHDASKPRVALRGDVVELENNNMSGQGKTTPDNDLACVFNHIYAYYKLGGVNFFSEVMALCYGDDCVAASKVPWFNQNSMAQVMQSVGITYTSADKSTVFPDFVKISEAEFLGRSFKLEHGVYNSRLRSKSILRSLSWRSPATALDSYMHGMCALESARYELARYIPSRDDDIANALIDLYSDMATILRSEGYDVPPLPSKADSINFLKTGVIPEPSHFNPECHVSCMSFAKSKIHAYVGMSAQGEVGGEDHVVSEEGVTLFVDQSAEPDHIEDLTIMPYPVPDRTEVGNYLYRPVEILKFQVVPPASVNQSVDAWPLFLNQANVAPKVSGYAYIAGTMCGRVLWNSTPFHMGIGSVKHRPRAQGPFALDIVQKSQLPGPLMAWDLASVNQEFEFEMPFINPINYIDIAETQAGTDTLTPRNRVDIFSYTPITMSNGDTQGVTFSLWVWIKPGTLQLIKPTAASAQGKIGQMDEDDIADQRSANKRKGDTRPTKPRSGMRTLSTFIKNAAPIANHVYDAVQSQELATDGPISSMTSAAASMLGHFTAIPVIGQYAKKAENAMTFSSQALAYFGYSRPTIQEPPSFISRRPLRNMAHAYAADDSEVIAMDPQQGVAAEQTNIAPTPVDQMSFLSLARRWSFMQTITWADADSPGDRIADIGVTGSFAKPTAAPLYDDFVMTPLAYVVNSHDRYKTDFEYLIVIVHARNMGGRFFVAYDPNGNTFASNPSNEQLNIVKSVEADDSGCTKLLLNIPYSRPREFINSSHGNISNTFIDPAGIIYNSSIMNGAIRIGVSTELVSPGGVDCEVALFVRAGPSFQVSVPSSNYGNFTAFAATGQIGAYCDVKCPYDLGTGFENPVDVVYLGSPPDIETSMSNTTIHFGERVASVRALVKRYTRMQIYFDDQPTIDGSYTVSFPPRPMPCFNQDGTSNTIVTDWGQMLYGGASAGLGDTGWAGTSSPITYFSPAFYYYVGGFRWKHDIKASGLRTQEVIAIRGTDPNLTGPFPNATTQTSSSSGALLIYDGFRGDGFTGGYAATNIDANPTLNVTIPFYTKNKFIFASTTNLLPASPLDDDLGEMTHSLRFEVDDTAALNITSHVAANEDFTLNYFICVPRFLRNRPWDQI